MRFEHLQFTGFGPYADLQTIDFASLHARGLFSVTGPTGAGKTTIFDALTFALYGSVPGARDDATTSVRSHHVPPTVKTEVILEFSTAGERWQIIRSPDYERPKARGTGTTIQKAAVALHRQTAHGWEPISGTRHEVDTRVVELVGLTRHQFERVALLPQGEFRRLLHAKSRDRRMLFRTLFGTEAIDRAVGGLRDGARSAAEAVGIQEVLVDEDRRHAGALAAEMDAVLATHAQAGVVTLPIPEPVDEHADRFVTLLRDRQHQLHHRVLPSLEAAERQRRLESTSAGSARDRAVEQRAAVESRRGLTDELVDLEEALVPAEQGAARAELARRARPVADVETRRQRATDEQRAADRAASSAREKVTGLAAAAGEAVDLDHPDPWRDRLRRRRHEVADLCTVAVQLGEERRRRSGCECLVDDLDDRIARIEAEREEATVELAAQRMIVEEAEIARTGGACLDADVNNARQRLAHARTRDGAREALDRTTTAAAAVEADIEAGERTVASLIDERADLAPVAEQLADWQTLVSEARRRHRDAARRDALNHEIDQAARHVATIGARVADLSRRFAAGIAPRLAAELIEGVPCPVCGSCEHPSPAKTADIDLVRESALQAAADDHLEATAALAGLRASLEDLAISADRSTDSYLQDRLNAESVLARSEQAVARLTEIDESLNVERSRLEQLSSTRAELAYAVRVETERLTAATELAGDDTAAALEARVEDLEIERAELEALAGRATGARTAIDHLVEVRDRLERDLAAAREQRAATLASLEEIDRTIAVLTDRVAPLNGCDPGRLVRQLDGLIEALDAVATADQQVTAVDRDLARLEAELDQALVQSGIPTVTEALDGVLPPDEIERLQTIHDDVVARLAGTRAALAQLDQLEIPESAPDVAVLSAAADAAEEAARHATENRIQVADLCRRAGRLAQELQTRLQSLAECQAVADQAQRVSSLCEGKGSARIGLEAFVLREHFAEVVHFANLRLRSISAGRYHLTLADEALDGRNEWGLDFTISDAHTGAERDVRSLSGGETFYTSLALALGLSDVLANRGATSINSVFIDEGFGSLDPDVVELTIDVLHQLHGDGVTVGVITHVEAVRDALPAGLVVERRPGGDSRVIQQVA